MSRQVLEKWGCIEHQRGVTIEIVYTERSDVSEFQVWWSTTDKVSQGLFKTPDVELECL